MDNKNKMIETQRKNISLLQDKIRELTFDISEIRKEKFATNKKFENIVRTLEHVKKELELLNREVDNKRIAKILRMIKGREDEI